FATPSTCSWTSSASPGLRRTVSYASPLTVKKNYRRVPYHNWTHGFSVANSMYTIIKRSPKSFKPLECLALFIGSLCHDLDHRGKNNKFMLETESPLAAIYTTSTLEHHHFNQTVTILQQEGHNIFGKLTSNEYKQVLGNIKHCILATDLALFFPNKAKLTKLMDENKFDWESMEHRLLIQAIAMTACDLCASAKPWDVQVETVKVIFEEFYEQGDAEKAVGKSPIPMMDRDKVDEQAQSQVGFLSAICIPCYQLLNRVIPNTDQLLEGCKANLDRWMQIVDEEKKKNEAIAKSNKEEDGEEETDTGIEEVNEEEDEEGEETLEDIDDEYINNDKDQGGDGNTQGSTSTEKLSMTDDLSYSSETDLSYSSETDFSCSSETDLSCSSETDLSCSSETDLSYSSETDLSYSSETDLSCSSETDLSYSS
ncbi:hypothetical protein Pcinc_035615, partial [Petrolisthes cinctipes]